MPKFISNLMYASMDPEEFHIVYREVPEKNIRSLRLYTSITAFIFAVGVLAGVLSTGRLSDNTALYTSMLCINLALFLAAWLLEARLPEVAAQLSWAYMASMYGFAAALAIIHQTLPSVTTVAVMILMPMLFIHPPIQMVAVTAIVMLTYAGITAAVKPPSMVRIECYNLATYGVAALAASAYQPRLKLQLIREARRNRLLSETDLLTGTRNRNAYQQERMGLGAQCRENVICVFADANGLHELNNTQGHEAGDRLLIAIANAMTEAFGSAHTYRVGGDEFVAFQLDGTPEAVEASVKRIHEVLAARGYRASIGFAMQTKAQLNMETLVQEAERGMYQEKQSFYSSKDNDRRKNR